MFPKIGLSYSEKIVYNKERCKLTGVNERGDMVWRMKF